ncbi:MAG TPA: GNAT family N-acetyltransferase [Gaiellaceae bacterium]|nr:GNAT family N-acetyltransferase [Gaiellaceae bacterium]
MTFEGLHSTVAGASFARREGHVRLLLPSVPLPIFNGVLVESEACAGVAESLEEVEACGVPCGVQLRARLDARAEAEAASRGLTQRTSMPGLAVAPDELVDAPTSGLEIAQAENEDDLMDAAGVSAAGFEGPIDVMRALYTPELLDLAGMAIYVGRVAGDPVTTAIGYRTSGDVGIFSIATPPEHRRRGYGAAITAHAVRAGFREGGDLAWLQTTAIGESVYRALGFRHVASHVMLTRPSPE